LLFRKKSNKKPFRAREKGQSLLEFALIFTVLMLMVAGITEIGFLYVTAHTIQNASREGARMAIMLEALEDNDPRIINRIRDLIPATDFYSGFRDGITNNQITDCDLSDEVTVTITGDYHFVALSLIGLSGIDLSFPTTVRYALCPE